jgi:formaldehyde dismutase / methanol dehydrogenase
MRWIAEALGEPVAGLSDTAAADRAVAAVTRLCVDLEMPENFTRAGSYTKSQLGQGKFAAWGGPRIAGDERDIERVTQHVLDDGRWNNNPNEMTPERIRRIVTASMTGSR